MRKFLLTLGLCSLAIGSQAVAQDTAEAWACPEGFEGQTLSVYNWSTYVAEDTISNFEAACGVTVLYDVYENNEALIARLRQGNPGYDIAVPSDQGVQTLAQEGLLTPLDQSMIPNLANVDPAFLDTAVDPGNAFSVPYQWGTIGLGYNVEAVGGELTSWEDVWNYDGPVAWLDDQRAMIGVALNILGYDTNTADPDEIAEARDFLIERGDNVVAIAADDGQALLERGEVDIAVEYNGDIFQIIADCECDDYAYVIPEEGTQLWTDNMVIPADAPNVELAHVFIDYILDPQVGADISNFTAYGSPNRAAIDAGLIDEELLSNTGIYPDEDTLANLFDIVAVPEAEVDYLSAWDEIRVALGR
jgi:spermidine/putrescine transport system substrate-binding protein